MSCHSVSFFRHLKDAADSTRASQSLGCLLPLLSQTTDNTQVLIMDTVESTLKIAAPSLDQSTCSQLIKLLLDTWMSKPEGQSAMSVRRLPKLNLFHPDPMLASSIGDVFSALAAASAASPAVRYALIADAFPDLSTTISRVRIDPFGASVASAIDIVDSIFTGLPCPLGDGVFAAIAPAVFEVLEVADDREMVQSCLNIITSVVRKDVDQLLDWYVG